jgi:hypothetical protein
MADTAYLVLRSESEFVDADAKLSGTAWKPIGEFNAPSSDLAIKACAEKHGKGEYVAVPARSWKPRQIAEVKQVTEVKFA